MKPPELPPVCREIQARAATLGFTVHGFFVEARVPFTYWSRWCKGVTPSLENMGKIRAVQHGPSQPLAENDLEKLQDQLRAVGLEPSV